METDDLIKALSADKANASPSLSTALRASALVAAIIAGIVFFMALGPRPDIADAAQTFRFLFKFVVALTLAGGAFVAFTALSRPDGRLRSLLPWLVAAPVLLVSAILLELASVPSTEWSARLIGTNSRQCLTFVTLIGIGPLILLLAVLRYGAPTNPMLAGAVAGVLAGAMAATFYAAHCTDDSPLFVATWYTLAIAGLAAVGALAASRVARW